MDPDLALRLAAFEWLRQKSDAFGDVLPRNLLQQGLTYQGERVPLVSPQGIFTPRQLDLPLTITTTPHGPYHDTFGTNGLLAYRYRGTDPYHADNVGLRKLMAAHKPLIYFHGIVPGQYLAVWPVYVVAEDLHNLAFSVAVEDVAMVSLQAQSAVRLAESGEARRAYLTSTIRVRLHQRLFRERVLEAYRTRCALCRLRHRELLDAAHIIPDSDPGGEPAVSNGLALCKLHHAAFDSLLLGVTPDYTIHIRQDVLDEHDGPVLQHGLQGLHNTQILLPNAPASRPNRDALAQRYQQFLSAA